MAEELNFSLPEAKKRPGPGNVLIIILLLAVLVVGGLNYWQNRPGGSKEAAAEASLTPEQLKELAGKLASRNFYGEAAETWKKYLEAAELTSEEEARALFQVGDLLLKAEHPEEALGYFYRSEMVKKVSELEGQINEKIKECFEMAGQFAALRYEIMERTSYKPSEVETGKEIVAQIGPEKVTAAQLGAMLEEQLDVQLRQYKAMLPPEQFNAQKEALRSQMDNPQMRMQFIQQMMAEEALAREALAEKLDEDAQIKRHMRRVNRQFLAQQYMEGQLAGKTHVDEIDVQTYYQAHKDEYKIEASAQISHILLDTQAQARDALKQLDEGNDFGKVAQEVSQDESTKASQGNIPGEIRKGSEIPGIGRPEGLEEKIFSSKADTILKEPVQSENGWHVIRVRSVTPQGQKSLEEVKDEIYQRLRTRKMQELQQQLIRELMDKYNIVIHQDAILKKAEEETAEDKDQDTK